MQHCDSDGQMMLFSLEEADEIYARPPKRKSGTLTLSTLISIPYFHLDLSKGHVTCSGAIIGNSDPRGRKMARRSTLEQLPESRSNVIYPASWSEILTRDTT